MYNRYIPRSDGSFQKNQVPDQRQPPPQRPGDAPPPQHVPGPPPPRPPQSPMSFLKNLLPRDFDMGDLLIVLLLLLMAGDCQEDQNTAILTLALYLFL